MKTKQFFVGLALTIIAGSVVCFGGSYKGNKQDKSYALPSLKTPIPKQEKSVKNQQNKRSLTPWKSSFSKGLGHIGYSKQEGSDRANDNLFFIGLSKVPKVKDCVYLVFDVKGISNATGISFQVNDNLSQGGYLVSKSNTWKRVKQEIQAESLHKGQNMVLFSQAQDADFSYEVKNIHFEILPEKAKSISIVGASYKNFQYVRGILRAKASKVELLGQELPIRNGCFEGLVSNKQNEIPKLFITWSNGQRKAYCINNENLTALDFSRPYEERAYSVTKVFHPQKLDSLTYLGSSLKVSKLALQKDQRVEVLSLRGTDLPALNYAMTNVTGATNGYRFLPHGEHFAKDAAIVSLSYDKTKIPSGYSEDDIRTFYFDLNAKQWIALKRIKIDKKNARIISQTSHFTDMINGIIKAPESPDTEGFVPTTMSNIKVADPAAKVNMIAPPTANNHGSANLQYSFELPPARNGMTPNLSISYNSNGEDGWLGEGWDLPIPKITIDTRWGVPRYNPTFESETYTLSGAMLTTKGENGEMSVAHRGEKIKREKDRQFYTRLGGDFSKIIRKGNSPQSYIWEVTDKRGVKYIYGGDSACLKGMVNNTPVIAEWLLAKVVEPHGDWIEYHYGLEEEDVLGGLKAKAIYLKEIRAGYSQNEETPHTTISFVSASLKNIKRNNARYGFLISSHKLLNKLVIEYSYNAIDSEKKKLRSYKFIYKKGAFNKKLLSEIQHLDKEDNIFSYQKLDYHNDIGLGVNNCKLFSPSPEAWDSKFDNISEGPTNASAIDGMASESLGFSAYVGAGANDFSVFKNLTGGVQYSYNKSNSQGKIKLIDINGDGLLDKVFEKRGKVFFRAQTKHSKFSDPILIKGLNSLSEVEYVGQVVGLKGNTGLGKFGLSLGASLSFGKGKTSVYFKDVNGDGLVDQCRNNRVYFNYIDHFHTDPSTKEKIGVPAFSTNSANTDSPINSGGEIDISSYELSEEEISQQIKHAPILDIVRTWVAPFSGNIKVESNVRRLISKEANDTVDEDPNDALRVAIQKGSKELWSKIIVKKDSSLYNANLYNLYINKGERIYFRLQSGVDSLNTNGEYEKVDWAPVITYTDREHEIMPNGHTQNVFNSEEGYVYSSNSKNLIPENIASFNIKGKLIKPISSDDIELRIYGSAQQTEATSGKEVDEKLIWRRLISKSEDFNGEITDQIQNPEHFTALRFVIYASTNVAWEKIQWEPKVVYNNGKDVEVRGKVKYCGYPNIIKISEPNLLDKVELNEGEDHNKKFQYKLHSKISPKISLYSDVGDSLVFTISARFDDKRFYKKRYKFRDLYKKRTLLEISPIEISSNELTEHHNIKAENVYFEVFLEASPKDFDLSHLSSLFSFDLEKTGVCVFDDTHITSSTIPLGSIGFYSTAQDTGFGEMYGGWGAFVYNAAQGRSYHPIVESKLKVPQDSTQSDILTMPFIPLSKHDTLNRLQGVDPDVFIEGSILSASRLGQKKIITNPMATLKKTRAMDQRLRNAGEIYYAPTLQNSDDGGVFTLGASIPTEIVDKFKIENLVQEAGNISGDLCFSFGEKETENFFIDMNGDGYPDWVSPRDIQYTNSQGGFAEKTKEGFVQENKSKALSGGSGAEGTKSVSLGQGPDKGASLSQIASANGYFGISGGGAFNWDEETNSLLDVNGDGLPDKLIKTGDHIKVRINLGYSFTEEKKLDSYGEDISKNKTVSANLGASIGAGIDNRFNIGGGSFSGGLGYTQSKNKQNYALIDINGDGLPDKVRQETNLIKDDGPLCIRFNTGNGFTDKEYKIQDGFISHSSSKVRSGNVAGTVNISLLLLKISLTLGANGSKGLSSSTSTLTDIDGDGYLDMVSSNTDDKLEVRRSNLGCVNKLHGVENSLGGKFFLNYNLSEASSDAGGRKWVMSEVLVDDGIQDDGPLMKTQFEYKNGKKDRGEREFLGFGEVITKQIDTEHNNAVYRKDIKRYDVSNYYRRGNLLEARIEDANGKVYSTTTNEYDVYEVTADKSNYNYEKVANIKSNHASALSLLRYSEKKQFDPKNQSSLTTSQESMEYDTKPGKYAELIKYQYSDKEELNHNGNGSYNYETNITYVNKPGNILSLPSSVKVYSSMGVLFRGVKAQYNDKGEVVEVSKQLDFNGNTAKTNFEYDAFGNITKKILPTNQESGKRMWYKYEYDENNMYLTEIRDAQKFHSQIHSYDYDYGIPLEIEDYRGCFKNVEIDGLGRVVSIWGPNEKDGETPLIHFDYKPANINEGIVNPAYAVTQHFDKQAFEKGKSDYLIETITFVDGFGRLIQTKKDGEVTKINNNQASSEIVRLVSGWQKYDAFGRVIESYQPTTETDKKTSLNRTKDLIKATIQTYDVLDRPVSTTLPDDSRIETEYSISTQDKAIVTTVTDPLNNKQASYTDGSGKTIKTELLSGPNGIISTHFYYDGIKRLIEVQDPEGNLTKYSYDMADRPLSVLHPASGKTTFTYDSWGNVLTKQTANLRKKNKSISYTYNLAGNLVKVEYPEHPENNVLYTYGVYKDKPLYKGRLMTREDGSGAEEYSYDQLGHIIKVKRTLLLGNGVPTSTFVSEWEYDSFNRLLSMKYPDDETVTYNYDAGGMLVSVDGKRNQANEHTYIQKLGYDKFGQRNYMEYGNGTKTFYKHDPLRQRLVGLSVYSTKQGNQPIMENKYTFDLVGNIKGVQRRSSAIGLMGKEMRHQYTYDNLYRLSRANGRYNGTQASYSLDMEYDNLGRITKKEQKLYQKDMQFTGNLYSGYKLNYQYRDKEGKRFQIACIKDDNYRSLVTHKDNTLNQQHDYAYDDNGNLLWLRSGDFKADSLPSDQKTERRLRWDEDNRLLAIADNGFVSHYIYDADGDRTVKITGGSEQIFLNGQASMKNGIDISKFTLYVNPFFVLKNKGQFTKHYYINGERFLSKIGITNDYGQNPNSATKVEPQKIDWGHKKRVRDSVTKNNYLYFGLDTLAVEYIRDELDEDSFRTSIIENLDDSEQSNQETKVELQFYYHKDHLGSSSYITDLGGEVIQQVEYIPFGEVFLEKTADKPDSIKWQTPYLFNGKELDEETGLYYYGARYYDPRVSIWLSVDPLAEKYPSLSPYNYCANNPIKFIDPDGMEPRWGQLGNLNEILSAVQVGLSNFQGVEPNFAFITRLVNTNRDLNRWKGQSLIRQQFAQLAKYFSANRLFKYEHKTENFNEISGPEANVDRYIYTTQQGWIDMHHFFTFAGTAIYDAEDIPSQRLCSYATEVIQDYLKDNASGFSYEDLVSNRMGFQFGLRYRSDLVSGKISIQNALKEFLTSLGAVDPEQAPNFNFIPYAATNSNRITKFDGNPLTGSALRNAARNVYNRKARVFDAKGVSESLKINRAHESIRR